MNWNASRTALGVVLLLGCGAGAQANMTTATAQEVQTLLQRLSEWESKHGSRFSHEAMHKDMGESNAAIDEIKRRLDELGARYHWQERTREYVLDAQASPGGEGKPDLSP
jgi:hypothetical protein